MRSFVRFWRYLTPRTIYATVRCAGRRRLPGLAAEIAFNGMLGLFPAVLAMLTAIGLFGPLRQTFQQVMEQFIQVAPEEVVFLVQGFADELSGSRNRGLFSLSFAIALWASSAALNAAMIALDEIHQIPMKRRRPFWKARLIALGLTLGSLLLSIVALTVIFIGDVLVRVVADQNSLLRPGVLRLWQLLSMPLALGVISTNFAFIYRFGPSRWMSQKPLMPGAIVAAVGWALLSNGFRVYVTHFGNYQVTYGAIGAVIVLMVWLYLSCLVMLLGDQLNVTVGEAMKWSKASAPTRRRVRLLRSRPLRRRIPPQGPMEP